MASHTPSASIHLFPYHGFTDLSCSLDSLTANCAPCPRVYSCTHTNIVKNRGWKVRRMDLFLANISYFIILIDVYLLLLRMSLFQFSDRFHFVHLSSSHTHLLSFRKLLQHCLFSSLLLTSIFIIMAFPFHFFAFSA